MFEIIVSVLLVILVFEQFDLWERIKEMTQKETKTANKHPKKFRIGGMGAIVIVAIVASLIITYFQVRYQVEIESSRVAVEELIRWNQELSNITRAVPAEEYLVNASLDFTSLYWVKFVENALLYTLIPVLIGLSKAFAVDEVIKYKERYITDVEHQAEEVHEDPIVDPVVEEHTESPVIEEDHNHFTE